MEPGNATTERQWPTIILEPIQVTGFVINLPTALNLHVKEKISLYAPGVDGKDLEIRSVFSPTQICVGEVGKPFTQFFNPSAFDGGRLEAKTQRNEISGDIFERSVYEEEPAMAKRTIEVTSFGHPLSTPLGQITIIDPETRIISGPCMNPVQIRERVPSVKKFTGTVSASGSVMTFSDAVPFWIVPTVHVAVVAGGGSNLNTELTIISVDPTKKIVTFSAPVSTYTGSITLDASIGEVVKATHMVYDPASLSLTKIYHEFDFVVLADLI